MTGSFGWRSCDSQGARGDGAEVMIGCLASAYAGCYYVLGFETVVVPVPLQPVEMLVQGA